MKINIEKKYFWIIIALITCLIGVNVFAQSSIHSFDEISGNIPASRITGKVASAASADSTSYATTAGNTNNLSGKSPESYGCINVKSSTLPVCGACSETVQCLFGATPRDNCPGNPADPVGICPSGYTKKSQSIISEQVSLSCPGKCAYTGQSNVGYRLNCGVYVQCPVNKKTAVSVCCLS